MKKIGINFFICSIIFYKSLFAEDINALIGRSIISASNRYNIEPQLLASIIESESNYHPYPLAVVLSKYAAIAISPQLKLIGVNYKIRNYKSKKILAVFPNSSKQALRALKIFQVNNLKKYDLGFCQINKGKIDDYHLDEKRVLVDIAYSTNVSAMILRKCMNMHKSSMNAIECYNKGEYGNYSAHEYYKIVLKNYNRMF